MKKQEINLIFYILGVIIIFLINYFFVFPEYNLLKEKNKTIKNLSTDEEFIKNYYDIVNKNLEDLNNAKWGSKKNILEQNFDSSPFFSSIVKDFLRTKALESGLIVSDIYVSRPVIIANSEELYKSELIGPVNKTRFELSLEGNYFAFKNFISTIEKSSRIGSIESISIDKNHNSNQEITNDLLFKLSIDYYSY
jgi:Tfp pilus assembly protein PilO